MGTKIVKYQNFINEEIDDPYSYDFSELENILYGLKDAFSLDKVDFNTAQYQRPKGNGFYGIDYLDNVGPKNGKLSIIIEFDDVFFKSHKDDIIEEIGEFEDRLDGFKCDSVVKCNFENRSDHDITIWISNIKKVHEEERTYGKKYFNSTRESYFYYQCDVTHRRKTHR